MVRAATTKNAPITKRGSTIRCPPPVIARAARDLEDALRGLLEESQIFTVELRELEGVALFSCFCIIGECGRVLVHKVVEDDLEALVLRAHEGLVLEEASHFGEERQVAAAVARVVLGLHRRVARAVWVWS